MAITPGSEPRATNSYFASTRNPWANLIFLAPLLAIYEGGVLLFGHDDPGALRNGADVWIRWGLARYGVVNGWAAPLLVATLLVVRAVVAREECPRDIISACFGMAIESILFAIGLWIIAKNFDQFMHGWDVPPTANSINTIPAAGQLVTYIGAGIYEEVLFRIGLFAALWYVLKLIGLFGPIAMLLAGLTAAVAFAAAHHIGPTGEAVSPERFLFRVTAGLYFTTLYVSRGYGIAVGTHAGYDVLVGVSIA